MKYRKTQPKYIIVAVYLLATVYAWADTKVDFLSNDPSIWYYPAEIPLAMKNLSCMRPGDSLTVTKTVTRSVQWDVTVGSKSGIDWKLVSAELNTSFGIQIGFSSELSISATITPWLCYDAKVTVYAPYQRKNYSVTQNGMVRQIAVFVPTGGVAEEWTNIKYRPDCPDCEHHDFRCLYFLPPASDMASCMSDDPNLPAYPYECYGYLVVDDFESYTDTDPNIIYKTWKDGAGWDPCNLGNGTGSIIGLADPPYIEQYIVYDGLQSMPYFYDNTFDYGAGYYSEAEADTNRLEIGSNWNRDGVKALTLYFYGMPDSVVNNGGFEDWNSGTTFGGPGWQYDGNTADFWYATHLYSGGSVSRESEASNKVSGNYSLKVDKSLGYGYGTLVYQRYASFSDLVGKEVTFSIKVKSNAAVKAYIDDGVSTTYSTAHTGGNAFENLIVTKSVSASATKVEVGFDQLGLPSVSYLDDATMSLTNGNPPDPMYVALEDNDSEAVVYYDGNSNDIKEPNWHEWNIELTDFIGIDLNNVERICIGFGDRYNHPAPGGSGLVFFDELRLYPPRCVLSKRSPAFAKVDYAPPGNPGGDCVVDYQEIEIMANDWLMAPPPDPNIDLYGDGTIDFKDFALLANRWLTEEMWPR